VLAFTRYFFTSRFYCAIKLFTTTPFQTYGFRVNPIRQQRPLCFIFAGVVERRMPWTLDGHPTRPHNLCTLYSVLCSLFLSIHLILLV
jgi:hypothetical protein